MMPSLVLTNQSGGQPILSGAYWSGRLGNPTLTGVQLRVHPNASGYVYVSLSGGTTVNSGTNFVASGQGSSGLMDGMLLGPGDTYYLPKLSMGPSGQPQIYIACDPAASGQTRVYYELF